MPGTAPSCAPHVAAVVIRPARAEDLAALERLARLDSQRPLGGHALLAERDGRLVAALALDGPRTGRVVADPFAATADLVALLRVHAAKVARPAGRQEFLRRVVAMPRRDPALARG